MTEQMNRHPQRLYTPSEIVQGLLQKHAVTTVPTEREVALSRRLAALDRQAPELVQATKRLGVDIEHLGNAALPEGPMFYNGANGTGWVMGPATSPEDTIVPRQQGRELRLIRDAGVHIPRIYVAHELLPEQAERFRSEVGGSGLQIEEAEAAELVGPVPQPLEAVARGERMAHHSQQIVNGLRRTGKIAVGAVVGAVAIPIAAAGAVLAAPAMVDPIILGAIPAASGQPGEPASWYRLVSWDW